MEEILQLPLPYWLCGIAFLYGIKKGWSGRKRGWGIPMMTVLLTVGAWYLGDPLYNGYSQYLFKFGQQVLDAAWWEVLLFLISFALLVVPVNAKVNGELAAEGGKILRVMETRAIDSPQFQDQIQRIALLMLPAWTFLMLVALLRTKWDIVGIFFPYLGVKADPWARDRIGSGFDAFLALAVYLQLMLTGLYGAVLALAKRPMPLLLAGTVFFLSAPFYVFDRTRSYILAILLPGFMAFVGLRLRGGNLMRLAVIIVSFLVLQSWMKFIIENRDKVAISEAFNYGGLKLEDSTQRVKKHLGFNMYEELGYINYFIENGRYKVNWGGRYFAEIVNPIPRVIWPGKPMIGIDYAVARGMAYGDQDAKSGGVAASISTGMIGQGVVNFGCFLGPIAAALLMAFWVAILARQDYLGQNLGYLLLYAIGLVLTFNMGRDITLLVVYPFIFGWILLRWINPMGKAPPKGLPS
jgi:hypothetical protein